MDYIKSKIISILSSDSRVSVEEIAQMLTVEQEVIAKAIEELEDSKIILNYGITVNSEKVNNDVMALIELKVTPQKDKGFGDIARKICKYSQVKSCNLISGDYDFLVTLKEKNMRKIADFVHEKLSVMEEVNSTATHFVLKTFKEDGVIFEETQEDTRLVVTP